MREFLLVKSAQTWLVVHQFILLLTHLSGGLFLLGSINRD